MLKRLIFILLIIINTFLLLISNSIKFKTQAASFVDCFYNDFNNDGIKECGPYTFYGTTTTIKQYFCTDNNIVNRSDFDYPTAEEKEYYYGLRDEINELYDISAANLNKRSSYLEQVANKYGIDSKEYEKLLEMLNEFDTFTLYYRTKTKNANKEYYQAIDDYKEAHPEVVMNHTINSNITQIITNTNDVLYYNIHIPFDYDPKKSYPVCVVCHGENLQLFRNKITLNDDGVYCFNDSPLGVYTDNSFMNSWYNEVKNPGSNRDKYDCFMISIINTNEFFRGDGAIGIVNQYNDYDNPDAHILTTDETGDTTYKSSYSRTYDASSLSAAYQSQLVCQLIDSLAKVYNIDLRRQYITGFSLGGILTLDTLSHYPDRFAAGVSMCTASADISEENCKALTETNIWAISGNNDGTCNKYFSSLFVNKINECREKYQTGLNNIAQYSFFAGGHSNAFYNGSLRTAASGVSITQSRQILDFMFDSVKPLCTNHVYDSPTYTYDYYNKICTGECSCTKYNCSNKITETTNIEFIETIKPTCTTNQFGYYQAIFEDNILGTANSNIIEIKNSSLGHNYNNPIYKYSPDYHTCTATRICLNDSSHILTETKETTFVSDTKPTCTTNEFGHFEIDFDNPMLYDNKTNKNSYEVLNTLLNHNYQITYTYDYHNEICKAKGICLNDSNHVLTETVNYEYIKDSDATCTTDESGHLKSEFNNEIFNTQITDVNSYIVFNTKLNHNYQNPTYNWSDDDNSCTACIICLNDPNHTITETVIPTKIITTDKTCENDEYSTFNAHFSSYYFTNQIKENIKTDNKLNHNYIFNNITWDYNTNNAYCNFYCSYNKDHNISYQCEVKITNNIPSTCIATGITTYLATYLTYSSTYNKILNIDKNNHNLKTISKQASTCNTNGYNEYVICLDCNYSTKELLPLISHDYINPTIIKSPTTKYNGLTESTCSMCNQKQTTIINKINNENVNDFINQYNNLNINNINNNTYNNIINLLHTYNKINNDLKSDVESEYHNLLEYIKIYNNKINEINQTHQNNTYNSILNLIILNVSFSALVIIINKFNR